MAIVRSSLAFLGTDESAGDTIVNNATDAGVEVDVLGDNTSAGKVELYLVFTSTVVVGSVDVRINLRRITGQPYQARSFQFQVLPINGTQKFYLGTIDVARYMTVDVKNNATGVNATNVAVLGTLTKFS